MGSHRRGRKESRTCQSDEGKKKEKDCVRCTEDERGHSGQREGGTTPQKRRWGHGKRVKTNGPTTSMKNRENDERMLSGEKDSEELQKEECPGIHWRETRTDCERVWREDQTAEREEGRREEGRIGRTKRRGSQRGAKEKKNNKKGGGRGTKRKPAGLPQLRQ